MNFGGIVPLVGRVTGWGWRDKDLEAYGDVLSLHPGVGYECES